MITVYRQQIIQITEDEKLRTKKIFIQQNEEK